uniref:AlNc14C178G8158 protein n=1 Tax=Albugo laibachii Nc14 TaxID=890382 RepID=F0WP04_9STRA|nr:AlNc14C178G8158 [Albugo laibachii Nc14]|eukprot:CCA23048.1 AlNc14C178G8158 [Albugo laibachii Nc14]
MQERLFVSKGRFEPLWLTRESKVGAGAERKSSASVAQLGERQTEDLKVPGSIPGRGKLSQVGLLIFYQRLMQLSQRLTEQTSAVIRKGDEKMGRNKAIFGSLRLWPRIWKQSLSFPRRVVPVWTC